MNEGLDNTLPRKARAAIKRYNMAGPGSAVLVAVSGGADSVAVIHVLDDLKDSLGLSLSIAHLNHSLRGSESDEDAAFVEALAGDLGLECVSEVTDVRGLASAERRSLEDAGHQARRRFLMRVALRLGCDCIATGHHADDQAETVLIRLIRGGGAGGLAGIRPVSSDGFVRPLIHCRRHEIRRYLDDRGIPYREDSSNLDVSFLRNRIRHELIPTLQRNYNPSIVDLLCRTSLNMAEIEDRLSALGERALEGATVEATADRMSLDSGALRAYDKVIWRYAFQRAYKALAGDARALSHAHLQALVEIVESRPTGTVLHLPGGIRAERGYGEMQIYRHFPRQEPAYFESEVRLPGLTSLRGLGGTLETELTNRAGLPPDLRTTDSTVEFFDLKAISPPLTVRTRRSGDRIRPFGFRGTKKLKDLLIDLKVPSVNRDRLPVLTDSSGLLWVAGVRRSDRARITPETTRVLIARWHRR